MNEDFLHIDRIEKYLHQEMEGAEMVAFEQELKTNTALQQEFTLFQDMMDSVELLGGELEEADLQAVQADLKAEGFFEQNAIKKTAPSEARVIPMFKRFAMAASILFLIGMATFLLWPTSNPYEAAYAEIYTPEKDNLPIILDELESLGMTDTEKIRKTSLATALAAYEQANYPQASIALTNHIKQYPNDAIARLYLSLSAMENKNFAAAIDGLSQLQTLSNFDYKAQTDWYLALSYSQADNTSIRAKAAPLFKQIATTADHPFAKKAADMLARMK